MNKTNPPNTEETEIIKVIKILKNKLPERIPVIIPRKSQKESKTEWLKKKFGTSWKDRLWEVKDFFTTIKGQGGEIHFSQRELEEAINHETNQEKDKNKNAWVAPVVIGMGALILVLIGVIVYKNKKKSY